MIQAEVISSWTGDGQSDKTQFESELMKDHPVYMIKDVTGQTVGGTDPNAYVVLVYCDTATRDAIEADPNYFILWDEEIPDVF